MPRTRLREARRADSNFSLPYGDIPVSKSGVAKDDSGPEATNIEAFDLDQEADVEDQLSLFDGNAHPPEYYRRAIEEFNESDFEGEDYSPGTTMLIDAIEEQWARFVLFHAIVSFLTG